MPTLEESRNDTIPRHSKLLPRPAGDFHGCGKDRGVLLLNYEMGAEAEAVFSLSSDEGGGESRGEELGSIGFPLSPTLSRSFLTGEGAK